MIYPNKPPFVPDELYIEALVAKPGYDRDWNTIIQTVASRFNVSLQEAEEAQRKGIYSYYLKLKYASGFPPEAVEWYKEYVELERFFPKEVTNNGR